jgi:hypothetical protein
VLDPPISVLVYFGGIHINYLTLVRLKKNVEVHFYPILPDFQKGVAFLERSPGFARLSFW